MPILPCDIPSGDVCFFDNWPEGFEFPHPDDVRSHPDVLSNRLARVVRFADIGLVVKWGQVNESEGQALWLLNQMTNAPVPTVYGWYKDGDDLFLYMSLVEGVALDQRWPELAPEEKDQVVAQLRDIFVEVRQLRLPPDREYIGSLGRTPINDSVLYKQGPFSTTKEFHDAFVRDGACPALDDFARRCRLALPDDRPIVFSHCDLMPSNILVATEGARVLAVIDWERSGFYPDYWEWVKLWNTGRTAISRRNFLEPEDGVWKVWSDWWCWTHDGLD